MSPERTFTPAPIKPPVSFEVLCSLDIRLGTIQTLEPIPRTERLMKLRVDFGTFQRTVVAGIKQERSNPQKLVGLQTLFVVNIPPRRLRSEESQAMLLDVGFADGLLPALLLPERPMPNGARVG